jgi:hypothetical protein
MSTSYASRREYMQKYQREWIARRRAEWFKDKRCIDCGKTDNLEIDHRDPSQKVSHSIWSWSLERRDEEAAKCDVRCHACHVNRHRGDARDWAVVLRRDDGPSGTAWCGNHRNYLPINQFSKDRRSWNGLEDRCKKCRSEIRSPKKVLRAGSPGRES